MSVATTRRGARRTRLVAAAVIGTAVALTGCTAGGGAPTPGAGSSTLSADDCPGGGAVTAQDLLLNEITIALQKHDRPALVGLAGTPDAKAAMASWWDNLDAIGFTTGGAKVLIGSSIERPVGLVAQIGVHNKLDPTSTSNQGGKKVDNVIATDYELTVRPGADACHLQVTRWSSASHAPWDSGKPLYVVHTAHTVVAGDAAAKGQVDRIAPMAEHAATWLRTFFHHNQHDEMVEQAGHVLFVASNNSEVQQWFQSSVTKPKGWVADPSNIGGLAFPLPGVGLPMSLPKGAEKPQPISDGVGGARTLISPAGQRESRTDAEGVIVHEFTHDLLADDNVGYYLSGKGAPASTVEGAARLVESYFHYSPNDATGRSGKRLLASPYLATYIEPHLRQFDGRLPSDAEIYGTVALADYYYSLSASAYGYDGDGKISQSLQAVKFAYLNGGDPLSGVLRSNKGGEYVFWSSSELRPHWAQFVRSSFGSLIDGRLIDGWSRRSRFAMRLEVRDHPLPIAVLGHASRRTDVQAVMPSGVLQHHHQQAHDHQEGQESGHGRNHSLR